jgi:hypothetical protein
MKRSTRGLLVIAALVATASIIPAALGSPSAALAPASYQLPLHLASQNFNASPTGQIQFSSPLPVAEILPTVNATVAATLGLNHLLEIAPNASNPEHPTVVAEAAPETLTKFNGTFSNQATPNYFNLIATLPVYPTKTALWTSGTTIQPATDIAQQAILDVNYSLTSGPDGSPGVLVSWAVSGWPWANPSGDELALEYVVQINAGTGFNYCTGAPSSDAPDATCTSEPLAQGEAVWSSSLTALKGSGPDGSVAWISWGSQVGGSVVPGTPESAGAYFEQPGTSALVIAAPDGGASSVTGSTLFLLSPGVVGQIAASLAGNLPIYGGAAGVFAIAAGVGFFLARRRDRSIARDLAQ